MWHGEVREKTIQPGRLTHSAWGPWVPPQALKKKGLKSGKFGDSGNSKQQISSQRMQSVFVFLKHCYFQRRFGTFRCVRKFVKNSMVELDTLGHRNLGRLKMGKFKVINNLVNLANYLQKHVTLWGFPRKDNTPIGAYNLKF